MMQLRSALLVWRTLKQDQTTLLHTSLASPASPPGPNFTLGNASSGGDPIQPPARAPQQYLCSAAPARSSCRWLGTSACWSPAARSRGCRRSAPRAPPGTWCRTCVRQRGLAGQDRTLRELRGRDQERGSRKLLPPQPQVPHAFPAHPHLVAPPAEMPTPLPVLWPSAPQAEAWSGALRGPCPPRDSPAAGSGAALLRVACRALSRLLIRRRPSAKRVSCPFSSCCICRTAARSCCLPRQLCGRSGRSVGRMAPRGPGPSPATRVAPHGPVLCPVCDRTGEFGRRWRKSLAWARCPTSKRAARRSQPGCNRFLSPGRDAVSHG